MNIEIQTIGKLLCGPGGDGDTEIGNIFNPKVI